MVKTNTANNTPPLGGGVFQEIQIGNQQTTAVQIPTLTKKKTGRIKTNNSSTSTNNLQKGLSATMSASSDSIEQIGALVKVKSTENLVPSLIGNDSKEMHTEGDENTMTFNPEEANSKEESTLAVESSEHNTDVEEEKKASEALVVESIPSTTEEEESITTNQTHTEQEDSIVIASSEESPNTNNAELVAVDDEKEAVVSPPIYDETIVEDISLSELEDDKDKEALKMGSAVNDLPHDTQAIEKDDQHEDKAGEAENILEAASSTVENMGEDVALTEEESKLDLENAAEDKMEEKEDVKNDSADNVKDEGTVPENEDKQSEGAANTEDSEQEEVSMIEPEAASPVEEDINEKETVLPGTISSDTKAVSRQASESPKAASELGVAEAINDVEAALKKTAEFLKAAVARTRIIQRQQLDEAANQVKAKHLSPEKSTNVHASVKKTEDILKEQQQQRTKEETEIFAPGESDARQGITKNADASLKETEDILKAAVSQRQQQDLCGDNKKQEGGTGILLESELSSMQGVRDQIASLNQKCVKGKRRSICSPEIVEAELSQSKKEQSRRRASTGEVVRSKTYPKKEASDLSEGRTAANTKTSPSNLLKTYNKDLYYSNELNKLINVDPADSSSKGINFEKVATIVEECPSVCRAKYDLTFNGETRNLYPLFSLVSNQAPLNLIRKVFFENPFRFLEVYDRNGQTLMHYACEYNPLTIDTLTFLIHRGAHSLDALDSKQRSPLHTACANQKSEPEGVQFLLKETPLPVIAARDGDGKLPIDLAVENPRCNSALKKSLVDRAKENDSEIEQQALKKLEQERAAKTVDTHTAPVPLYLNQASKHSKESSVKSSPKGPSTPGNEAAVPNPSFWERLCCMPSVHTLS